MNARGRGSTHLGKSAVLPDGPYAVVAPPSTAEAALEPGGWRVDFQGEDGRSRMFQVGELPLPGWHEPLAAALTARIGPAGQLRTLSSVNGAWGNLGRLMRFLAQVPAPPWEPALLTAEHLTAFRVDRVDTVGEFNGWNELRSVGKLLMLPPLRDLVSQEVLDYVHQRVEGLQEPVKSGYSDGELRRLIAAARTDTAEMRDRLRAGEELVARWRSAPESLAEPERSTAELLAQATTATGIPDLPGLDFARQLCARRELASNLFVTSQDVRPLMVLLVALTGRNPETIKELPAEHRVLEDRAVELRLIKRRRGQRHWHETVTWEIGPPGRELHTPGGLYLLLHQLMARSRAFSGSTSLWSIWLNGNRSGARGVQEHHNPFARRLAYGTDKHGRWAARHALSADDGQPLVVDLQRLRTSIEVRRTKQMGGHLPSAARTNTYPVLFRNYLRGDPTVEEWAREVIGDALIDAERSALAAHERALASTGGQLHVHTGEVNADELQRSGLQEAVADQAAKGELDTAWSACTGHDQHPTTGRSCRASFLDCFHCSNCLVTRDHLPRLLGLLDALHLRRQQLAENTWWTRYGPTWAAIRQDILSKFSPAELQAAAADKPTDALLDLVEHPWEKP
jgi:hypothetical protein